MFLLTCLAHDFHLSNHDITLKTIPTLPISNYIKPAFPTMRPKILTNVFANSVVHHAELVIPFNKSYLS